MGPVDKEPAGLRKAAAQEGLPTDEVMERLTPQEIKAEELQKIEEEISEQQYVEYLEAQRDYYDAYDPYYDYDDLGYEDLPPLPDYDYDPWWDDY